MAIPGGSGPCGFLASQGYRHQVRPLFTGRRLRPCPRMLISVASKQNSISLYGFADSFKINSGGVIPFEVNGMRWLEIGGRRIPVKLVQQLHLNGKVDVASPTPVRWLFRRCRGQSP